MVLQIYIIIHTLISVAAIFSSLVVVRSAFQKLLSHLDRNTAKIMYATLTDVT